MSITRSGLAADWIAIILNRQLAQDRMLVTSLRRGRGPDDEVNAWPRPSSLSNSATLSGSRSFMSTNWLLWIFRTIFAGIGGIADARTNGAFSLQEDAVAVPESSLGGWTWVMSTAAGSKILTCLIDALVSGIAGKNRRIKNKQTNKKMKQE